MSFNMFGEEARKANRILHIFVIGDGALMLGRIQLHGDKDAKEEAGKQS